MIRVPLGWMAAALLTALPARAQEAPSPAASELERLEEVVVAGQPASLQLPLKLLDEVQAVFRKHAQGRDPAPQLYLTAVPRKGRTASSAPLKAIVVPKDPEADALNLPADAQGRLRLDDLAAHVAPGSTLSFNRSEKSVQIRLLVRTPPESAHQRRLGDLRLECRVNLALEWQQLPLLARMAFKAVDPCNSSKVGYHVGPLPGAGAIALVEGERTLRLNAHDRDRQVAVPLHDPGWGDAARLVFGD